MKTLYPIFFFLILSTATVAQVLPIDSTKFITGIYQGTFIYNAIPTADKGILFVGYDYGNPRGIIPYFPIDTANNNVLVGKIDSNRQISWIKVYGGSGDEIGYTSCQTPDGGFAVIGGTSSADGNVTGYKGNDDIWVLRLNASGNLLWEKCYGSTMQDEGISIASTADGGFIILGTSNGADGDVPFHYGDMWTFDWVVIKIDSLGNKQWSKDIGTTGDEQFSGGIGAIIPVDNYYYLIGTSDSSNHDCTDTAWHRGVYTMEDVYVLKLNDTGKVLWDSSYGGSGNDAAYTAFFDNRDSTIMIIGSTSSPDYMVTGFYGGDPFGDMWVVKISKNGTLIWQKALGGPNDEEGTGLCMTKDGGYLAYCTTFPGPLGSQDLWLFALDSSGNELGNKIFGGTNRDMSAAIIPYQNGYAATRFSRSLVFTEGTTYGNFDTSALIPDGGGAFVSYLEYWLVAIPQLHHAPGSIALYPNPAHDRVNIEIPGSFEGIITIIDGMGQEIYKQEIKQGTQFWDIATGQWPGGLYCVILRDRVTGEGMTAKLLKN